VKCVALTQLHDLYPLPITNHQKKLKNIVNNGCIQSTSPNKDSGEEGADNKVSFGEVEIVVGNTAPLLTAPLI
jgi:hypothetical protein